MWPGYSKCFLGVICFGKVFRMKILNPVAALFLFPKNIKCLFYRKPDRCGRASSPAPAALGCSPWSGTWGCLREEAPGAARRLPQAPGPEAQSAAVVPGSRGSSVVSPSDFSGREEPEHTPVHRNSTQLKCLDWRTAEGWGSECKREWKSCRRKKGTGD